MHVQIANCTKKWHRSNLDNNKNGQVLHNEKVASKVFCNMMVLISCCFFCIFCKLWIEREPEAGC